MSVRHAVVFAAVGIALPASAIAAPRHAFDIPAGRLGDALVTLGSQARISIGVSDPGLATQRVRGVRGRMSIDQVLDRLLRGTGARAVVIDRSTIRIVRSPPRQPRRPDPPRPAEPPSIEAPPAVPRDEPAIIVTASRRSVPLSSYPGSVEIVAGDDPALAGSRGSDALVERLAGLTSTHLGPGRNKLFIRGMSESSVNGFTQATVGQYFGDFRVNYNAPDPDLRLYDVGRVEVLEGPQGTLYGAGALGGIVRVMPNMPDPAELSARVTAGLAATAHGESGGELAATVNLPLSDAAAGRLTAYRVGEGGYIDDIGRALDDVNRVRVSGARLGFRLLPSGGWTLDATAIGQRIRGDDAQYAERDLPPLTRRSALAQKFSNDHRLLGLSAAHDGEWRDFTVSASHVRQRLFDRFDATAIGNPVVAYDLTTRVSLLSAEARLNGRQSSGASWVIGTAVYASSSDQDRDVEFFDHTSRRNQINNRLLETALFGEAQLPLTGSLDLTLGGRVSRTRLESEGFVFDPGGVVPTRQASAQRSSLRFLPTVALSGRPSANILLFGRYQEGFRTGGVGIGAGGVDRFKADRVRSMEAGFRLGQAGRGRFDLALSAGYVDWNDVQGDTLDLFAEPATTNIGDARNIFLDATAGWRPLSGLRLDAGIVVIDSKITTGPARGFALPAVAPLNARVGANAEIPVTAGVDGLIGISARYTGKSYLDSAAIAPGVEEILRRRQGGWVDVGLLGQLRFGRVVAALNVTNLLDSQSSRFALGTPLLLGERQFTTPVRPRTARLTLEFRY